MIARIEVAGWRALDDWSNIMLHEFDAWLEGKYLSDKARKDR